MKKLHSNLRKFYVGDPCYALNNEHYNIWGDKYNYEDGIHEINGFYFAVYGTEFGDGSYQGSNNINYSVDSGTIALIPFELVNMEEDISEGSFIESKYAELLFENGDFIVKYEDGEIIIPTGFSGDEKDEDYFEE